MFESLKSLSMEELITKSNELISKMRTMDAMGKQNSVVYTQMNNLLDAYRFELFERHELERFKGEESGSVSIIGEDVQDDAQKTDK